MDTEHIINPARELLSNLSVTAFNILGQAVQWFPKSNKAPLDRLEVGTTTAHPFFI